MKLAVFDVDGTLIQSTGVDDECYLHALKVAWGLTDVCTDWNTYRHVTESGISSELFQIRFGRPPLESELIGLRLEFERQLRQALDGRVISQVPGASQLLDELQKGDEWRVAIATGSWLRALQIKTDAASLKLSPYAVATADDALDRGDVIQAAVRRAESHYGLPRFSEVVYVGDGLWDIRAATSLGIPFVGVASGEKAEKLSAAGAVDVMPDFTNLDRFVRALRLR